MENTETLREWFERVDSEKTSSITALQLKSAFAVGNLEFSLSVVQQMIRMYDFDRNGTMSFEGGCIMAEVDSCNAIAWAFCRSSPRSIFLLLPNSIRKCCYHLEVSFHKILRGANYLLIPWLRVNCPYVLCGFFGLL
ncbi:uncharacterized protein LOC131237040 isoform X12 [Magnolia sinica]|uniref:uncharacterized protein LOC131237040 isoform X12 n=1 Tax=Magnolia sinica TaxID=86752 RepID=UPI00265A13C7|nr:uncharacterized protein LOC131237040 isoform X12 [Magnolia sinica]